MRKIFWPAARSATSRSSSATRSAKADRGTPSPYTKGFCITANPIMVTDYHVTVSSVVPLGEVQEDACSDEVDHGRRQGALSERGHRGCVDHHLVGQVLAAGAELLFVVL